MVRFGRENWVFFAINERKLIEQEIVNLDDTAFELLVINCGIVKE